MHICHINLASSYHGGENQTFELIQQQIRNGYEVTALANPKGPLYARLLTIDCTVHPIRHHLLNHTHNFLNKCDLLHVHEGRAVYWALIQKAIFGTPYIITRRIDNPISSKWITRQAYQQASALVGLSKPITQQLKKISKLQAVLRIPSSPVSYPVSEDNVKIIQQQFAGKFLVLQAANMLKHKGFDTSIKAAKQLNSDYPNIHFCFIGDGSERHHLEQQATNLKNITFVGKQSNMGDWFHAADLLVHPSHSEGLGSVILEGMKAGLPVVGSNAGGIPDIIHHEHTGLLTTTGCGETLASNIIRLYNDPALRGQLVNNAHRYLNEVSIESCAEKYEQVYLNAVDNACLVKGKQQKSLKGNIPN
ncbi:glycosyltransferase family 4 protein [Vibrio agarivorans]|uniref:Glycosyltransferase family 4 protein n=1 Tax=Vibrio agarivorans TaxID=153622 RepID=A0ABT7XW13_9VIBR|nr:glycosyltransferase family 4 protein [Vibrio agarivorans]MDN2479968.1 glycosyltransferase family 4 protein [Vibrio agarivorans]